MILHFLALTITSTIPCITSTTSSCHVITPQPTNHSHHDTLALLDAKARQLQQELLAISRDARLAPART